MKRGAGYFKKVKYNVTIEKPGYQTEAIVLEGTPGGWYIGGNLLFGGGMGWVIVDPATGAMWTLEPSDVNVTLMKTTALGPRDEGLTVALRADLPAELAAKLKPVNLAGPQRSHGRSDKVCVARRRLSLAPMSVKAAVDVDAETGPTFASHFPPFAPLLRPLLDRPSPPARPG